MKRDVGGGGYTLTIFWGLGYFQGGGGEGFLGEIEKFSEGG